MTMSVSVCFQCDDFYVVDKPMNIGFHDEDEHMGFFNNCKASFNEELYPVHRLDKMTSGLLILARNKSTAQWFQSAFEQGAIQKYYLALSDHRPKKKQGSVVGDMVKARHSQWKLLKSKQNPAVSRFHSWGMAETSSALRLFLVKPETGKTHQIRVALKSIGAAILGDTLYQGSTADRGYLHAFALRFDYKGETIALERFPNSGDRFLDNLDNMKQYLDNWSALSWSKKR
jgi:tRNA pseudouridine32 synthase/23S rRNA pseudouridine746 synthase